MSDMVTTGQTALNGKPHNDDAEARDVTGGIEGESSCLASPSCPLVDVYSIYRMEYLMEMLEGWKVGNDDHDQEDQEDE